MVYGSTLKLIIKRNVLANCENNKYRKQYWACWQCQSHCLWVYKMETLSLYQMLNYTLWLNMSFMSHKIILQNVLLKRNMTSIKVQLAGTFKIYFCKIKLSRLHRSFSSKMACMSWMWHLLPVSSFHKLYFLFLQDWSRVTWFKSLLFF